MNWYLIYSIVVALFEIVFMKCYWLEKSSKHYFQCKIDIIFWFHWCSLRILKYVCLWFYLQLKCLLHKFDCAYPWCKYLHFCINFVIVCEPLWLMQTKQYCSIKPSHPICFFFLFIVPQSWKVLDHCYCISFFVAK